MEIIPFLVTGLYGIALVVQGYKELRDCTYKTYIRPNLFKKGKYVVVEGKRIIPIAIYHMLLGLLLGSSSLYKMVQDSSYALTFILIWIMIYMILDVLVVTISLGSITKYDQPPVTGEKQNPPNTD